MLKRCLLALVAVFIMTTAQIAAAADWNWSTVTRVNNLTDLAKYIETERQAGKTVIPAILTEGLTVSGSDFLNLCPSSVVNQKIISNNGREICVEYTLMDYPGTKVANAYLSGSTLWLTPEEKQLYAEAVTIVNEANKNTTWIGRELYIYQEIMKRSQYMNDDMSNGQERFTTAMGVLLDGKANCQGYADAFYMLGRMCGLNVGRMSGKAGGGGHQWNTITFPDGKTYFVDVTWGDEAIKFGKDNSGKEYKYHDYKYFNAPVEIMQVTHSWDGALAPANLQPSVDGRYGYSDILTQTKRFTSAEAGEKFLAQELSKNSWAAVMVPLDENYFKNVHSNMDRVLKNGNRSFRYSCSKYGKYLFIFVYPK